MLFRCVAQALNPEIQMPSNWIRPALRTDANSMNLVLTTGSVVHSARIFLTCLEFTALSAVSAEFAATVGVSSGASTFPNFPTMLRYTGENVIGSVPTSDEFGSVFK